MIKNLFQGLICGGLAVAVLMGFVWGLKYSFDTFPAVHSMIDAVGSMLLHNPFD